MDLIIGGAYQGKKAYAAKTFSLAPEDFYACTAEAAPRRDRRCVTDLEEYVRFCVRTGQTPDPEFRADAVLICRDIFGGVVPMDAETRLWREETGRFLALLAARADTVTRLFCGLPQRLK